VGKKLTTEEFVKRACEKHGNRCDYSNTVYRGIDEILEYVCKLCGPQRQIAKKHLKSGCGQCGRRERGGATRKQFPGREYTFGCGHTAFLPSAFGDSNEKAIWKSSGGSRSWVCRKCLNHAIKNWTVGVGPSGLLSRMKYLISVSRSNCRKQGGRPVDITGEELLIAWEKQGERCAWTGEFLDSNIPRSYVLEHDHDFGKFRGFVTSSANKAEGFLRKLQPESRARLLAKMFPEEVKRATELLSETMVKDENDKRRTTSSDCVSE